MKHRVVHVQNILAFYRVPLWNRLVEVTDFDFELILLAVTEKKRARHSWKADFDDIGCPKTLLHDGVLEERKSLWYARRIWRELSRRNPDLVLAGDYVYPANWAAALWCRFRHVPFLCHYGSTAESRHRRSFLKEKIKGAFFSLATHVAAYGTLARDYAVSLGIPPDRVTVIGNATPFETLAAEVAKLRREQTNGNPFSLRSQKEILFVGRLSSEKNLLRLVEAFQKARKESGIRDMRLVLVGDGPLKPALESVKESMPGTMELPGYKQRGEIAPYFARARALVLASVEEPWGLVVNEAMACGLPVLVSERCGCVEDLLARDGAGIRFDPLDADQMSRALARVMGRELDLDAMGREAAQRIAEFSPEKSTDRLVDQIRGILADA